MQNTTSAMWDGVFYRRPFWVNIVPKLLLLLLLITIIPIPKLHPKSVNIQICGAVTSKISIIMKNLQSVV